MTDSDIFTPSNTQQPLQYGEPVYKSCSDCAQAIEIRPLLSGNPVGGDLWSDGYMDTPFLPEQQLLGACPHCSAIVFLASLEPYSLTAGLDPSVNYQFEPLCLEDYDRLIENLHHIAEDHHAYLRIKYWHMGNHPRRNQDADAALSENERDNLIALLELLGNDDPDRLMQAEIYRELGDFDNANRILSNPFYPQVNDIVLRLRTLVKNRNSSLEKIYANSVESLQSPKNP